jgi:hypothetical protein
MIKVIFFTYSEYFRKLENTETIMMLNEISIACCTHHLIVLGLYTSLSQMGSSRGTESTGRVCT